MHIYTNGSTNFAGGSPQNGLYALVVGTGQLGYSLNAVQVSMFSAAPGSVSVQGTVSAATSYGFSLNTPSAQIPIVLTSSTVVGGAPLTVGSTVTVSGTGSASVAVLAVQIVVAEPTPNPSSSPTPTPGPIAMTHVPTADYLGGDFGKTHWAPGQWGAGSAVFDVGSNERRGFAYDFVVRNQDARLRRSESRGGRRSDVGIHLQQRKLVRAHLQRSRVS